MEWIETTAKTIEEAQETALDKLGVDTADAEFEVLEEPRQGLFGRTRGQARIRARIAPQSQRGKDDGARRKRKPRGKGDGQNGRKRSDNNKPRSEQGEKPRKSAPKSDTADDSDAKPAASGGAKGNARGASGKNNRNRNQSGSQNGGRRERTPRSKSDSPKKEDASMEEVSTCVETFLSGLTEAFGLDTGVVLDTSNDEIMATIEGKHGLLLGPKARTLDAIQELTRVTAQRTVPSSIRIKVDVGGYRQNRKELLQDFARKAGAKAVEESVEVVLEPMSSADRKVVHDELNDFEGVDTRSAGTDPRRRVVVVPAPADEDVSSSEPVASDENSGDAAEDVE